MKLDKFDQALKGYLASIALSDAQDGEIVKGLKRLLSLALTSFPDANLYAQGSYATDTMVKPLTSKQGGGVAGEFDIDIAIDRTYWGSALGALQETADAVQDDDDLGELKVDNTKNSCVRVQYPEDKSGVAFHMDLVPTESNKLGRQVPDRKNKDWKSSDAKQFAQWFNEQANKKQRIRQVSVILKRLRDLADMTDDLKSIFILSLVTSTYRDSGSIMSDLVNVLDGASELVRSDGQWTLLNPVNDGEDLVSTVADSAKAHLFFQELRDNLVEALKHDDQKELKAIFGYGFEYTPNTTHGKSAALVATAITAPVRAYGC